MIELYGGNEIVLNRKSSKGNQLKWEQNGIWYKADYTGYEGLSEYVVSKLLELSNLKQEYYVNYLPEEICYKQNVYNGVKSSSILKDDWQIITLERLYKNYYNQSLTQALWILPNAKLRLKFLVDEIQKITGLRNFGIYISRMLTIDAFFLNEDRHMHNIAVLMDGVGSFSYCPYFDHGAALLSDTTVDYSLEGDIIQMITQVKGKTIATEFDAALDVAEQLFGMNIQFYFTKKDIETILNDVTIYNDEIKQRVKQILFQQMRKYSYLLKNS